MKHCPERNTRKRGTTLVEMMAVIALSSLVLGLVGLLLNGAWQVQKAMGNHRVVLDSIGRLGRQLRDDVHRAETIAIVDEPSQQKLVIHFSDESVIEYRRELDAIERIVRREDKVVQRESYAVPAGAVTRWEIETLGSRQEASLILKYPLGVKSDVESEYRQLKIDAVVSLTPREIDLKRGMP